MTKLKENPYGYIYFMAASSFTNADETRWILQTVTFGHHLIYCNYGKINANQLRLDFSPFTSIYTAQVWYLILLNVVTLLILLQYSRVTVWFDAVTVFIRQIGSGKNYFLPISLTSLLCLPLLALYENELSSKIIVPRRSPQLNSLREILENNFEIYGTNPYPSSQMMDGLTMFRNYLRHDFETIGLTNKLSSSLFVTDFYDQDGLLKLLLPKYPARCILLKTFSIDVSLNRVQNQELKGRYKCFKIENIALAKIHYDLAIVRFIEEMRSIVKFIFPSGVNIAWREWGNFIHEVKRKRILKSNRHEYINMDALVPFILGGGLVWVMCGIVFMLEIVIKVCG
ncbi:hypothetical protein Fcan01_11252 [Folsomia candida]|uniref:Uncharacterized protein n=1 Tax=Folsomia candida TaxID=158441 RepID=A0A226E925_FOLCA|nr:hypothetical protein Fcan01_11252 [Folsomia candida]